LRTAWRIKDASQGQGNNTNARPDFQQLMLGARVLVWCDSQEEESPSDGLEHRVRAALSSPDSVSRFGGWSLGESSHLIDEVRLLPDAVPPEGCLAFLLTDSGSLTLPVWVDHVGSAGTRYAVGSLEPLRGAPPVERLAKISP
jgi:CRISPR-associated protein Cas5t